MSHPEKVKPSVIGAFVLGALLLGLAAVVLLSDGAFARNSSKFLLYFEGDIKGLQVGAPVNFRGVKIGQVESMSIDYDSRKQQFSIPVIISIESRKVGFDGGERNSHGIFDVQQLIRQGLRARLNLQSIVTGKLEIELDMMPDSPLQLMGGGHTEYPEIPTVQSSLEKIASAFEELPLQRITRRISEILDAVDRVTAEGQLERTLSSIVGVAERLDRITQQLDREAPRLLAEGRGSLQDARALMVELSATARETRQLLQRAGARLEGAFDGWESALTSGEASFAQLKQTAATTDELLRDDSALVREVEGALRELTGAAKSIRNLADYLERHPEALLRGKQ